MNNYSIEILHPNKYDIWNKQVSSSVYGSLFNTSLWSDVISSALGITSKIHVVLKNGNIVGGINVFSKKKFGMNVITPVPLTNYNGFVYFVDNHLKEQKLTYSISEINEILINTLKKEFKYFNYSLNTNIFDVRNFLWKNCKVLPRYTYLIDLRNKEKIWESFSGSLRRKLSDVDISKYKFIPDGKIEDLLNLHKDSYHRKNIETILSDKILKGIILNAQKKDLVKIFSVEGKSGEIISSRAVLVWHNHVYDWIAGSKNDEGNTSHFLVWNILKYYSEKGFKVFDFMGANTPKIIDFKQLFGGHLTPYYEVEFYSSQFINTLFWLNKHIHKLRRGL